MIRYQLHQKPPSLATLLGKSDSNGTVCCIGNFDGVHLGHQTIMATAARQARSQGQPLLALLFDPHPTQVLRPGVQLPWLSSLPQRQERLLALGVDLVVILEFSQAMAQLSAAAFCQEILVDWLQMRHLCVGAGFHLGHQRQGDAAYLQAQGKLLGFTTEFVTAVMQDGQRISSSAIRQFLQQGDLDKATAWLGRPYQLEGRVMHGSHRGQALGFATANLSVDPQRLIPARGVYVTAAHWQGRNYPSVTNIGVRPSFSVGDSLHVETHLLGEQLELYDQPLQLDFLARLRDEQRFAQPQQLQAAIAQDIAQARSYFANLQSSSR